MATARTSRRPSVTVDVSHAQLYGEVLAVQAVVHVLAPAGEVSNVTEPMPRLELATALSITTPRSGVPGSVSVTETVLKLAAALKVWFGFVLWATKAASDEPMPIGSRMARTARAVSGQVAVWVRTARSMGDAHTRALRLLSAVWESSARQWTHA